jgi:hypothetical protein
LRRPLGRGDDRASAGAVNTARSFKTVDLKVRPIHHHLAERVRAHVFLCMLAYYVEWHMREMLAPMLFDDDDKPAAQRRRASVVAPAQRSPTALAKAHSKRTADGAPSTVSKPCSRISRPSPRTASAPQPPATLPSTSSPPPPRSNSAPSTCSLSLTGCRQYEDPVTCGSSTPIANLRLFSAGTSA